MTFHASHDQFDAELRERFQQLARAEATSAPAFGVPALRTTARAAPRRPMVPIIATASLVVGAAVATVMLTRRNPPPPWPIDLNTVSWTAPSDFLLDTPGSELLRTVPAIVTPAINPEPPRSTRDTSTE